MNLRSEAPIIYVLFTFNVGKPGFALQQYKTHTITMLTTWIRQNVHVELFKYHVNCINLAKIE